MRRITLIVTVFIAQFSFGQIVNIPDVNFKNALLNHNPVIDTNGDGEIQLSEAEAFTGVINVNNQNISDLTGIQVFTNITELNCISNNLTEIDVTQNINLTTLLLAYNNIPNIDVSQNTALVWLATQDNPITVLDITQNTALDMLWSGNNNLTSIDVSNNIQLSSLQLWGEGNQISEIDLSQNFMLNSLAINGPLTELDVSHMTDIALINLRENNLVKFDVSNNPNLSTLVIQGNNLINLDVSNNPNLSVLTLQSNNLQSLNIANGNNENLNFYAIDNPNLTCIQVDSGIVNNIPEDWEYDEGVEFNIDCDLNVVDFTMNKPTLYPNPTNDILYIESVNSGEIYYQVYTVSGNLITKGSGNQISLQNAPAGLYFATIKTENGITNHKIVKR